MQKYNKAVVAILGGIVTLVAAFTNIEPTAIEGLVEPVAAIVTAALVYFVPNKSE